MGRRYGKKGKKIHLTDHFMLLPVVFLVVIVVIHFSFLLFIEQLVPGDWESRTQVLCLYFTLLNCFHFFF